MNIPQIPSWDALHPLVIHFPVALLLVAPLLIVLGLLPRMGRGYLNAALVLMILGTVAAWVAVSTGEAAGELAARTPAVKATLEQHEELAETTRALFTAFTLVFAALLFLPRILRRQPGRRLETAVGVLFLLGYSAGAGVLAETAHQGGRLVHVHGVHALMPAEPAATTTSPTGSSLLDALNAEGGSKKHDDDDDSTTGSR